MEMKQWVMKIQSREFNGKRSRETDDIQDVGVETRFISSGPRAGTDSSILTGRSL